MKSWVKGMQERRVYPRIKVSDIRQYVIGYMRRRMDWGSASDYITENMCCVESLEGECVRGLASEVRLSSILFANL